MNDSHDKQPNTIAHFADTEGYPGADSSHPVEDASSMQTHYPTAKTADERYQEDIDRQEMLESRLPKLFRVKIAISTTAAFMCLLAFSTVFEGMWSTGETGVIFQSFGLGLAVAFVAWLSINYTRKIFYTFGRSLKVFWANLWGCGFFTVRTGYYWTFWQPKGTFQPTYSQRCAPCGVFCAFGIVASNWKIVKSALCI